MRRTLGMAVFAGMIGVTVFGLFLTPVFYYVVRRLARRGTPAPAPAEGREHAEHSAAPAAPPLEADSRLKVTAQG